MACIHVVEKRGGVERGEVDSGKDNQQQSPDQPGGRRGRGLGDGICVVGHDVGWNSSEYQPCITGVAAGVGA